MYGNFKKIFYFIGVKSECLPMCQYNASLSEIRPLTALCTEDMGRITKCASGIFEIKNFINIFLEISLPFEITKIKFFRWERSFTMLCQTRSIH